MFDYSNLIYFFQIIIYIIYNFNLKEIFILDIKYIGIHISVSIDTVI